MTQGSALGLSLFKIGSSFSKITHSVINTFNFYPNFFSHVKKHLDNKAKINVKFREVATSQTNNCNTYIAQNPKK